MDLFSHVYFNFFSLGALIPAIFMFFAGFFLASVPDKTSASKWLMFAFFSLSFFNLAYAFPAAIYHSNLAYHRYATGTFVFLAVICMQQFFLDWPVRSSRKVRRGFLYAFLLLASIELLDFIYHITLTPKEYNFRSMLWDFTDFAASKRFGILLILFFFTIYITGIVKAIRTPKKRLAIAAVTFGFFAGSLPPGIINVLSRDGLLSRDIYQLTLDSAYILGFFLFLIIYINVTQESTTFMARIITITLALFLLVMTPVSYFSLNALSEAYQDTHRSETALVIEENAHPEDLRYIAFLPGSEGATVRFPKPAQGQKPDLERMQLEQRQSLRRSLLRTRLLALPLINTGTVEQALLDHLKEAPAPERPYLQALLFLNRKSAPGDARGIELLFEQLDSLSNKILFTSTKIKHLHEADFRDHVTAFLKGKIKEDALGSFLSAVLNEIQSSRLRGAELKQETLRLFAPYAPLGRMFYRYNRSTKPARDQFTAFHYVAKDGSGIYEVGYSYLGFRAYLHRVARNLFVVLISVTLVILVLFRLFFLGSLIRPLETLIAGVRKVNEGNLDVQVPVHVEDEIGFLTRSFNGMVESIRLAQQKLKDYADKLEDKVKIRTAELQNTLEEVQNLKQQQDGDYFLTALLTRPLGRNLVKSESVKIDFLVHQKKHFSFRNRDDEIGGDLCKAHDIVLRDRKYVVFLNADAMGKSIQGAGGVLVLGSVFESIINRTRDSAVARSVYPERWLKNVFLELHKVFESFDGSMLVSLVLGLIDTENGLLYYMNAEHPASVLYRNGEAGFIDEDMMFRKLGTQGVEGKLFIQTLQLEPGDVIIAGSDGRDDLLLGEDEDGNRIINEDEYLFLDIVREAKGDIHSMPDAFRSHGELTDDLSLLRVEYTGHKSEPLILNEKVASLLSKMEAALKNQNQDEVRTLLSQISEGEPCTDIQAKALALAANQVGEYEKAAHFARRYVEENPGDLEMIYRTSILYKRLRLLEDAADLAERIRLRQPGNVRNLIHLADIYFSNDNLRRARKIIGLALEQEPNNEKAKIILQHIEAASTGVR